MLPIDFALDIGFLIFSLILFVKIYRFLGCKIRRTTEANEHLYRDAYQIV